MVTFLELKKLHAGFKRLSFEYFSAALQSELGGSATPEYCQQMWPEFQRNPLEYCATREPEGQGQMLMMLAINRAGDVL